MAAGKNLPSLKNSESVESYFEIIPITPGSTWSKMRVQAVFKPKKPYPPEGFTRDTTTQPTLAFASLIIYFNSIPLHTITFGDIKTITTDPNTGMVISVKVEWVVMLSNEFTPLTNYTAQVFGIWSNCVSSGYVPIQSTPQPTSHEHKERKTKRG